MVKKTTVTKNCDKFVFGEALAPVKFRNLKNYGLLTKFLSEKQAHCLESKNCPIWSTNARKFSRDAFTSSIERKECQVFIFKCPPMLSDGYIPLGRKKPTDSFIKTISNGWFEIPKFIMQCLERVEGSRIKRDKSASSAQLARQYQHIQLIN